MESSAALFIILPLLKSLDYLHSSKIIHRDIKPDNCVVIASTSQLKLADFGLSIHQAEERPVTRCGTLGYMSPEIFRCPDKSHPFENKNLPGYGSPVDIWAVGVMAFEMVCGFAPFPCGDDLLAHVHQVNSDHNLQFPLDVSAHARSFITACLAKAPRDRPSARDLIEHLWIKDHLAALSSPATVNTSEQPHSGTGTGFSAPSLYASSHRSEHSLADQAATISICSN